MKVRVNEKSLSVKINSLLEMAEGQAKDKLGDVAEDLTVRITVDTGAYAESFSVRLASDSGGRSRSSRGRPRNQSTEEYRSVALSNMMQDIASLDLLGNSSTSVSFRNRAPHASQVEKKYQVFGAVRDRQR